MAKTSGSMILEFEFKNGSFIEICNKNVKFWLGTGLPDFEGDLDGFSECYPNEFSILLEKKLIKKTV